MRIGARFSLLGALALVGCSVAGQEPVVTTTPEATTSTAGEVTSTTTSSTLPPTSSTSPSTTTSTTLPPLNSLAYREVASMDFPIHLVPFEEGADIVATKAGRLFLLRDGESIEGPILDIADQVHDRGERGLLGVAADGPGGRVFVHYSANGGDTTVSRFTWDGSSLGDETVLLTLDQPASNHNGGMIQLGPDGALYLGLGDGGGSNDRFGNGQNTATLLGGLVRVDPETGDAELFQYGLRNPWRFWIEDESIFIADVGQNAFEEVSVAALDPDVNYGWPITEGLHCFRPSSGCDSSGLTLPVIEVPHGDDGTCSITGGVVYRGEEIPEIDGHYFYSDFCGGYLRSLLYEDGALQEEVDWTDQVGVAGSVASFGVGGDGSLYVLTTNRILEVVADRGE